MRVIITGPENFHDYNRLCEILGKLNIEITEIVSSGDKGVTSLSERWASENKVPVKEFRAKWKDMSEPCLKRKNKYGEYNALAAMKRDLEISEYADGIVIINSHKLENRMLFMGKFVHVHKEV